jgi:hypothetical protein
MYTVVLSHAALQRIDVTCNALSGLWLNALQSQVEAILDDAEEISDEDQDDD